MPARKRLTAIFQLLLVLLCTIAVPAWVCRSKAIADALDWKQPRAPKPRRVMMAAGAIQDAASAHQQLREAQAEWVLIGNSTLNSRIEPGFFARHTGKRVFKLGISATKSAMWFLMLKQMVIESGTRPRCVSIFFRDQELTWPELHLHRNAAMIERLGGREEPEWELVLDEYEAMINPPWQQLVTNAEDGLKALYPAEKLRTWARGSIQLRTMLWTDFGGVSDVSTRRAEINSTFALHHQRDTAVSGPQSDEALAALRAEREALEQNAPLRFDPSPDHSFLPHMITLAKQSGISLHFHRIKVEPSIRIPDPVRDPLLPAYLKDLEAYLASEGCLYTDETDHPEVTSDMFFDATHLHETAEVQESYMKIFWRQVQPALASVLDTSVSSN